MEQSGAYIFLIVNASFWGIILVLFIINNVGFFRRRLVQERLERMKILKTSAHLDLWRFLVQRDVRDPKIKPAPPNAQGLTTGVFSCLTFVGNLAPFAIGLAVSSGQYELPQLLTYSVPVLYGAAAVAFVAAGQQQQRTQRDESPPA